MFNGLFSSFMVDTWVEASVMAVVAGTVGFFVVLRGSTFAAHAIPQGAFTGAAGAALIGASTLLGVGVFSLLGVLAIARWGRRGRSDVVVALVLVTLLGIGSLFLSMSTEYAEQTFSLLFGQPLAVSSADLLPTAIIGAGCIAMVMLLYRSLLLSSVAPELATAQGIGPGRIELLFLLAVGAVTTMALPVVGALLVFSLMIGPPGSGTLPYGPAGGGHGPFRRPGPGDRLGVDRGLVRVELAHRFLRRQSRRRLVRLRSAGGRGQAALRSLRRTKASGPSPADER